MPEIDPWTTYYITHDSHLRILRLLKVADNSPRVPFGKNILGFNRELTGLGRLQAVLTVRIIKVDFFEHCHGHVAITDIGGLSTCARSNWRLETPRETGKVLGWKQLES